MYDLMELKNAKGLHFAHLNVRSLVNKWDNIKANFVNSDIHVLTFSETWLHNLLPSNLFELGHNYSLLRQDRNWNDNSNNNQAPKRGGGLCTYIKNTLQFSDTEYSHYNSSSKDIESQWISIFQKPNKTILLGNLYRPPQGDVSKCIDFLDNVLSDIDLQKIEVFLMGDLNLDISDKNNAMVKSLLNMTKQLGLRQLILEPTRYSPIKDSCIDLLFTNSDIISKVGVSNVNLSDHQMILLTRKKAKFLKHKCEFIGRSYRNYNRNDFQNRIRTSNWDFLDDGMNIDIDRQWNLFEQNISIVLDEMCPKKTFRIKQVKQPWITPRLLELILDKDKAMKKAKKSKRNDLWNEAKRLRNACTNRLRKAKAQYIKEQLEIHSNDQKKFWKHIQEVIPNSNKNTKIINLKDTNTGDPIELNDTADYINNFFINIGPNLAKNCHQPWQFTGNTCDHVLENIETSSAELTDICKTININKASCVTDISSEILKDAFLAIPGKLCLLFNNCFRTATTPSIWKHARVTPLPKGGDSQVVSNYRPISLLPLLSKLIEKIVHKRLYNHLTEWNLLDERQGGFRPGHSTISTCSYFTNDLYTANNNNEITIAVFIDAMKAFDTVNHKILIDKLKKYGISGNLLTWIENYLTNRKQCTVANNIVSTNESIVCGVPQGSVLGPLLFLLYINDISSFVTNSKISMYADDTVIYLSHANLNLAIALIQSDLDRVHTWCNSNKLTINCKKTKFCMFGMRSTIKHSKTQDVQLSLSNQILERVCSYKYLGLILDEHLTYNKHIKEMNRLVSHKLYLLSKVRKYITTHACINIFKTMVLSLIEYCDILYTGTNQKNLGDIDKMFYRGLKICTYSNNFISRETLCKDCKIAPLDKRRNAHLLIFMHKQTNNQTLIKKKTANTRLHTGLVFNTYKPNNEKAKANVFYRGAILWNALEANSRNMDFEQFKSIQKQKLTNHYLGK